MRKSTTRPRRGDRRSADRSDSNPASRLIDLEFAETLVQPHRPVVQPEATALQRSPHAAETVLQVDTRAEHAAARTIVLGEARRAGPAADAEPTTPHPGSLLTRPPERRDQVGPYVLERVLGRGGMGVVFKARHLKLERNVALKVMTCDSRDDAEEARRRFATEARAAARLSHPRIVSIHDVGAAGQWAYMALELIDGPSLGQRLLDKGPLEPRQAAEWLRELAQAVAAAHAAGILHRDLKPGNVLVGPRGPVLTDFGLAKLDGGEHSLTVTGTVLGTPAYMPPEQAQGQRVDERSDVYGLGAVLYECLTGQAPFSGETPLLILRAVVQETPARPRALAPDVPRPLEEICLRCLAKRPEQRYASAQDLADDLARLLAGEPLAAVPSRRLRAPWWLACGGAALAAGLFFSVDRTPPEPPAPPVLPVQEAQAPAEQDPAPGSSGEAGQEVAEREEADAADADAAAPLNRAAEAAYSEAVRIVEARDVANYPVAIAKLESVAPEAELYQDAREYLRWIDADLQVRQAKEHYDKGELAAAEALLSDVLQVETLGPEAIVSVRERLERWRQVAQAFEAGREALQQAEGKAAAGEDGTKSRALARQSFDRVVSLERHRDNYYVDHAAEVLRYLEQGSPPGPVATAIAALRQGDLLQAREELDLAGWAAFKASFWEREYLSAALLGAAVKWSERCQEFRSFPARTPARVLAALELDAGYELMQTYGEPALGLTVESDFRPVAVWQARWAAETDWLADLPAGYAQVRGRELRLRHLLARALGQAKRWDPANAAQALDQATALAEREVGQARSRLRARAEYDRAARDQLRALEAAGERAHEPAGWGSWLVTQTWQEATRSTRTAAGAMRARELQSPLRTWGPVEPTPRREWAAAWFTALKAGLDDMELVMLEHYGSGRAPQAALERGVTQLESAATALLPHDSEDDGGWGARGVGGETRRGWGKRESQDPSGRRPKHNGSDWSAQRDPNAGWDNPGWGK